MEEIKYKLSPIGVVNLKTGANIPKSLGNRYWNEYQEWLKEGNTPLPELSLEDHKNLKRSEINKLKKDKIDSIVGDKVTFDISKAIYLLNKFVNGVATPGELDTLSELRVKFESVNDIESRCNQLLDRVDSAIDEEDLTRIVWEK